MNASPGQQSAGAAFRSFAGFVGGSGLVIVLVTIAVAQVDVAARSYWQAFEFVARQMPSYSGLPTAKDLASLLPMPKGYALPEHPAAVWIPVAILAGLWNLIALVVFRLWVLRVPLHPVRGPIRDPFALTPLNRHFLPPGRLAFAVAFTVFWPLLAARAFHDRSDLFSSAATEAPALREWALWPGSGRTMEGWLEAAAVHAAAGALGLVSIALAGALARRGGPFPPLPLAHAAGRQAVCAGVAGAPGRVDAGGSPVSESAARAGRSVVAAGADARRLPRADRNPVGRSAPRPAPEAPRRSCARGPGQAVRPGLPGGGDPVPPGRRWQALRETGPNIAPAAQAGFPRREARARSGLPARPGG